MCFFDTIRYSCSADLACPIEICVLWWSHFACIPHVRQTLYTPAICDACAQAYLWSEHYEVMRWIQSDERESLQSIAEGDEVGNGEPVGEEYGHDEAVGAGAENLASGQDVTLGVEDLATDHDGKMVDGELVWCSPACNHEGNVKSDDGELIGNDGLLGDGGLLRDDGLLGDDGLLANDGDVIGVSGVSVLDVAENVATGTRTRATTF